MQRITQVMNEGAELNEIRQLFLEYEKELDVDLSFQQFQEELADPLRKYSRPKGTLILAYWNDRPVGTIALTPMNQAAYCEMKRLYVRPMYRQHGIGRRLIQTLIEYAVGQDYRFMRLDTFQKLKAAVRLYQTLGFYYIEPYYVNPLPGVVFMEKELVV